jgi:hypothetical protein
MKEAGERSERLTSRSVFLLMFSNAVRVFFLFDSCAYLLVMPLEFTDRWIQLVEGNDFDAEVFAHIPGERRRWEIC